MYSPGTPIEFNKDRLQTPAERSVEYMPNSMKYKAGQKGHIVYVSPKDGNNFYVVSIGMGEVTNVPEEDITPLNADFSKAVEERLRKAQEKKEFKDSEGRIGGSKKEKRAYQLIRLSDLSNIENDPALAIELVKKDKVYPKVDIEAEKEKGTSSGATFLKVKLRDAFGSQPPNNKEKRKIYVGYIAHIVSYFADVKKVDEFKDKSRALVESGIIDIAKLIYPELSGDQLSTVEDKFMAHLGMKAGYYSKRAIVEKVFEEVFGARMLNFMKISSESVLKLYSLAKEYEALTKEESDKLITERLDRVNKSLQSIREKINKIPTLKPEEYDQLFKEAGYKFIGGEFAKWGHRYYSWEDCKLPEQKEAFKERYLGTLKQRESEFEGSIEKIKEMFRPRENNWDWALNKRAAATGKSKAELKINTYPPLSYIKRTGGIIIKESDVNVQFIRDKFGFKEVEFGQSLKDVEAREHIRHFLGAIADLGDILNMDIAQLNKLGGLSIAFASRGGGKASAHYETLRKVINITKTKGGGAVAHEWSHYLDNILPLVDNPSLSFSSFESDLISGDEGYLKTPKVRPLVDTAFRNIFKYIYNRTLPEGMGEQQKVYVRKIVYASDKKYQIPSSITGATIEEYFDSFKLRYSQYKYIDNLKQKDFDILGDIVHKFGLQAHEFIFETKHSSYYSHSLAMNSAYWIKPWELFARAFETYIFDKLDMAERVNNYLVSGVYFDTPEQVYPAGIERKELFKLYDVLMDSIQQEYSIDDFKPWTEERVKEYIALEDEDKEEKTEAGVIVDENTGIVVENVEDTMRIQQKIKELTDILSREQPVDKMEHGGYVDNDVTSRLNNFLSLQAKSNKKMEIGGEVDGVTFLDPAVIINMDNYKPYKNIHELREKASDYLMSLRETEFSLNDNPEVKFRLTKYSISHTLLRAGETNIIATKQIEQIFKQSHIFKVSEPEPDEQQDVDYVLKCRTHISINGVVYTFRFVIKHTKRGEHYFYDGTINIYKPEIDVEREDDLK